MIKCLDFVLASVRQPNGVIGLLRTDRPGMGQPDRLGPIRWKFGDNVEFPLGFQSRNVLKMSGRGGQIRTDDFLLPKQALYQAELRPDFGPGADLWPNVRRNQENLCEIHRPAGRVFLELRSRPGCRENGGGQSEPAIGLPETRCGMATGSLQSRPDPGGMHRRMKIPKSMPACPRDHQELKEIADRGLEMHACGTCSGLWLPKASLVDRLDRRAIHAVFHSSDTRASALRCPRDGTPLWEFNVGGVAIDRCNSCGGLWFDAGELATLIDNVGLLPKKPGAASGTSSLAVSKSGENPVLEIAGEVLVNGGIEVAGEVIGAIVKFIAAAVIE